MRKYLVPILAGVAVMAVLLWGVHTLFADERPPATVWFAAILLGVFTTYIMANMVGTRKTATASAADRDAALAAPPTDGKSALYLYREGFIGKAAGLNVFVDGKAVAQLKAPRFTRVSVAPGRHTVRAAFAGLAEAQNKQGELALDVAPGEAAVVRLTLSMGALQNTIRLETQAFAAARPRLARMPMTVPDLAEA